MRTAWGGTVLVGVRQFVEGPVLKCAGRHRENGTALPDFLELYQAATRVGANAQLPFSLCGPASSVIWPPCQHAMVKVEGATLRVWQNASRHDE